MPTYIQNTKHQVVTPDSILEDKEKKREITPKSDANQIGFALDQSGSMASISDDAILGFNTLVAEQQKPGIPPAKFSLALFNDEVNMLYDSLIIREVSPLNGDLYKPTGNTALNDAIGHLILEINKGAGRSARVLIAILTDGMENSSCRFSIDDILQMVSYRRLNYDWQFVFIGPKEAVRYALQIGIPKSNIVELSATSSGIRLIMDRLSKAMRAYQLGDRRYALQLTNRSL